MRSPEKHWAAVRVAAVAMLAWSCSSLPTEPTVAVQRTTPEFVRVSAGGATSFGAGADVSAAVSQDIDGASGGTFSNGHFQLVIPPGAFSGTATLTITVPDPSVMQCELHISPPEANRFAVPVQLVADCGTATGLNAWAMRTLWFDEARSQWVVVSGTTVNTTEAKIITPLSHFSEYGVVDGKAGW